MSIGPSPVEREAQQYRQNFGNNVLPGYINQSQGYINQGISQLNGVNSQIQNYISGIGNDPNTTAMRNYLSGILSGKNLAAQMGPAAMATAERAQATLAGPATLASAATAQATGLGMRGNTFAQMFGSDLGGLALQQRNMQTVADKLASTTNNPFSVLTAQAKEDAAFQNAQGMSQLRSQLASQGLDVTSGTGAAALAALQFNTNKQVADAARQNAVQGAQFQQQGLQAAAGIYGNIGNLDLQRASTAAQLGLQGYQADLTNASRMDQVAMQNAQLLTNVNLANAGAQNTVNLANAQAQTNVALANAQAGTNVNIANAQAQNQAAQFNAGSQNQWMLAALQGQLGLTGQEAQQRMAALGLLSNNANSIMGMGGNMWNAAFAGQQNYMGQLNQAAQASAQGRGQLWGGLINGAFGLAGAALTGGGTLIPSLVGLFAGSRGAGTANVTPASPVYTPVPFTPVSQNYIQPITPTFGVQPTVLPRYGSYY